jgi:hypothetical protein
MKIFGQWNPGPTAAWCHGFYVVSKDDRYYFSHWNDKNIRYPNGSNLIKDKRTKFYIEFIYETS